MHDPSLQPVGGLGRDYRANVFIVHLERGLDGLHKYVWFRIFFQSHQFLEQF
jgi:hypothetical protein